MNSIFSTRLTSGTQVKQSIEDRGIERLASAIIARAFYDYANKDHKKDYKEDCKDFFKSEWYRLLAGSIGLPEDADYAIQCAEKYAEFNAKV